MAQYYWEGKNSSGKKVKGVISAANPQAAFNQLKAKRISPNINKIKEKGKGLDREIKVPGFAPKVKSKDIVVFTRQFATMIDAGLPIVQGLDVLARQHENPAMRKTLGKIKNKVEVGGTLADGMREHPNAFDNLFVNMIAAGEAGGILDIILERLANYMEKSLALRRQVKTAMIYPSVVVFAAIVVTAVLLIFVIPTFAEMFSEFGAALPAPTMFVLALSDFMVDNYYFIGFIFTAIGVIFKKFLKTERGKEVMHPLFLKLPVIGELIRKVAVARFTRTLGTMLSSGVPILEALSICSKTAGNKVVEREVNGIRVSISEGKTIAEPLFNSVVFPPMVVQMIAVGESTGALDAMLNKVADFYESEVEVAVGGIKQLIEPLMILFLGTVVGGLVIAMYLPIFKLGSVIH